MKRILITTIIALITSLSIAQNNVYVNYVTHNEDNYNQYVLNQPFYIEARTMLRQFAIDCKIRGAKWSMGNDYKILEAILAHDTGPVLTNTNGLNFLHWLQDSMDVELDPHAHAGFGNPTMADVAYMHTLLDATPSSVISGYLQSQADNSGYWWYDYENPVASVMDPTYTYNPEVIWGGATPNHVDDPLFYGIWKPTDVADYYTHDASKRLINYGNGCRIKITDTTTVDDALIAVDSLLDGIDSGDYPSSGFYPISLFIAEHYFWDTLITSPNIYSFNGDFLAKINEITDSINVRVALNKLEWMHIEDIVEEWKTTYSATPFFISCDHQEMIGIDEKPSKLDAFSISPNPTKGQLTINPSYDDIEYDLSLINISGQEVLSIDRNSGTQTLQVYDIPRGIYVLKIMSEKELLTERIILN